MKEATSKEKVLKKIRQALIYKTDYKFADIDLESNVYTQMDEDPTVEFARAFTEVKGKFIYSPDAASLHQNLKTLLDRYSGVFCLEKNIQKILTDASIPFETNDMRLHEVKVGVTSCEALVSRTGSIIVSSGNESGRRMSVYPPVHLVIAYSDQLFPELKDAIAALRIRYNGSIPSMLGITTGPSRTSDIEKTLVFGAHGPKELYLFLTER